MSTEEEETNGNDSRNRPTRTPTAASDDLEILSNDDSDTLRIMVTTDNHLGYAERDPVRGMDSFAAFEEILYLAKHRYHCDMVLIAGDLFHENRPSRRTLHKTMEIIRRYCMGSGAVKLQILSNQVENFRSNATVNYQDPYYSVDLPIFSIHGNHDDPSRDSGGELLAALDLLAVSNLVNYWGRQDQVDRVEISPVLIQKGKTKVALYGLGSMRDERLNRMWDSKKVRFLRPEEDDEIKRSDDDENGLKDGSNEEEDDTSGFFNIFTLHQNRDLGRGGKNCVQESMIPEWMDLVIWGHEHECLIEFFESVVGTFRITQPGSSVATSLIPGEAARKKVGILDINGKNFRMHAVPLTQVRSFVTTELSLREHRDELDPEDPKIEAKVTQALDDEVRLLIMNARQKKAELIEDARAAGSNVSDERCKGLLKYTMDKPNEVLVRVRVEHMGFSTLNNQRFGAKFVGEVANPNDILLFHRKKDAKLASTVVKKSMQPIAPEELERTNMEDLVREALELPERKLKLLEEQELTEAMEDYVEKSLIAAIADKAHGLLKQKQMKLIKGQNDVGNERDPKESSTVLESLLEASQGIDATFEEEDDVSEIVKTTNKTVSKRKYEAELTSPPPDRVVSRKSPLSKNPSSGGRSSKAAAVSNSKGGGGRRKLQQATDDLSDDEVMEIGPLKAASKDRPQRGRPKKGTYMVDDSDEEDVEEEVEDDDDDDDDDEDADELVGGKLKPKASSRGKSHKNSSTSAKTKATRKPAATPRQRSNAATGTARKKETKTTVSSRRRKAYDDSDEDDGGRAKKNNRKNKYDDDDDGKLDDDWGTAATTASQRAYR